MKKVKINHQKLSLAKERITNMSVISGGDGNLATGLAWSFCYCPGASAQTRCGCVPEPPKTQSLLIIGTYCTDTETTFSK